MTDWENPEKANMKKKLSMLNAYYIADIGKKFLYKSISPVNTFRIVFNTIFASNLGILSDKSYFNLWSWPYDFLEIKKE